MESTTIFVIGLIAAAVLVAGGILTVAVRRGAAAGPITGEFDKEAAARDMAARAERQARIAAASGGVATLVREETELEEETEGVGEREAPPVDRLLEKVDISADEFDVTRRRFLNRALLGLFGGAFMGGLTISFLAFLWPKLKGGFGTSFNVGTLEDLRTEIVQPDGTVVPKFVAAAQTWLISFPEDEMAGSSFEDLPVLVGAGGGEPGLMALWQRCVHLGCRVPSCVPSQGFECPCHGSRYNFHGEYEAGPAPRNLDRFEVSLTDAGELVVNTGAIFQTPRSKNKTATYPQGPSCV